MSPTPRFFHLGQGPEHRQVEVHAKDARTASAVLRKLVPELGDVVPTSDLRGRVVQVGTHDVDEVGATSGLQPVDATEDDLRGVCLRVDVPLVQPLDLLHSAGLPEHAEPEIRFAADPLPHEVLSASAETLVRFFQWPVLRGGVPVVLLACDLFDLVVFHLLSEGDDAGQVVEVVKVRFFALRSMPPPPN